MRLLILTLMLSLLFTSTSALALTLDEAVKAALNNHQRIEQFRANADRSQAAVGSARAAFLPRIDLGYDYTKQEQDPFLQGTETSVLSLSGSINLFNGLGDFHSYQAVKHRATGADYQLQGVLADIILETKRFYIEVLRAEQTINTANEGVELLQRQQRDSSLRFEHGVIARNDLLRVEVELSSSRQDLLRAEGNYQSARRRLERVIGARLQKDEKLQENSDPRLLTFDLEQGDAYQKELLKNRSELNFLREFVAAAKREQSASKGNFLPDLNLTVAHEEYGSSFAPTGRDNNYDDDDRLMLNASWNLFDGFATSNRVAAAEANTRAIDAELRDTKAALLLQLEVALNEARIAFGQLEESQIGVSQAEENYRVTDNQYKQQQSTTFDLLDARFLLTRARNRQVNARYDLYLTSAALERILERAPLN